jgi:hypothetical protein
MRRKRRRWRRRRRWQRWRRRKLSRSGVVLLLVVRRGLAMRETRHRRRF